jgi:vacuolar protein sorting-associated protein 35
VEASTQAHADLSGDSVASMYGGLLTFAEEVYPDRLEYVDNILEKTASVLEGKKPYGNGRTEKKVMDLLSIPLEKYELKTVLGLRHFTTLIDALGETKKKDFAMKIATMACQRGDVLTDAGSCVALFNIVERILTGDEDDIEDDASLMAKLMHCFNIESTSDHIRFLMDVFERVSKHGTPAIKHVGPAVVFSATRSIHGSHDRQSSSMDDVKEWYVFLVRVCKAVANASAPGIAIQLLLRVGVASQDELLAYECFEHACVLYEDFIFDSKECSTALYSIIHALYKCGALAGDSRHMLAFKATSYCSKLLRRKDQCRAILACCHIYWQERGENSSGVEGSLARDGASVFKLLERAERTVHALMEQNTLMEHSAEEYAEPGYLMVDILNKYTLFKKKGVEEITAESIDKIIRETDAVMQSTHVVEAGDVTLQAYYKTSLVALKNTTS